MEFKVRKTKETDFLAIIKLLKDTGLLNIDLTEAKFKKLLGRNGDYCFVAETDGNIVGTAFGMTDEALHGYTYKVAVSEKYRRNKIASKLSNTIDEQFQKAGVKIRFAHVKQNNKPSIKLLESLNFKHRETHQLMDKGL